MGKNQEADGMSQRLSAIRELHPELTIVDPCCVCHEPILGAPRIKQEGQWAHLPCVSETVEI